MTTILETPRLILRKASDDDLDALAAIYADPEVMRYVGSGITLDREQTLKSIRQSLLTHEKYGHGPGMVIERESEKLIGRCGLLHWEFEGQKEMEVAYIFARDSWGKGYATEMARGLIDHAFANFDVPHIISLIVKGNAASVNVARKNGLRYVKDMEMWGQQLEMYKLERERASL